MSSFPPTCVRAGRRGRDRAAQSVRASTQTQTRNPNVHCRTAILLRIERVCWEHTFSHRIDSVGPHLLPNRRLSLFTTVYVPTSDELVLEISCPPHPKHRVPTRTRPHCGVAVAGVRARTITLLIYISVCDCLCVYCVHASSIDNRLPQCQSYPSERGP